MRRALYEMFVLVRYDAVESHSRITSRNHIAKEVPSSARLVRYCGQSWKLAQWERYLK